MTVDEELGISPATRRKMDISMALALIAGLKRQGLINERIYQACKKDADKMIDEAIAVKS